MSTEITVAIIAFLGVLFSAFAAFLGSILGNYFNLKIAKQTSRDKYNLAALDKKLEKHQEAFDRVWDFPSMAHKSYDSKENTDQHKDNLKWWRENCLYLEPKSRSAFINALSSANIYDLNLESYKQIVDRSSEEYSKAKKELYKEWDSLYKVRHIIEEGVSFPLFKPNVKEEFTAEEGEIEKKLRTL